MYKNVNTVILTAPARTGGNHLSNLIRMSPTVNDSKDIEFFVNKYTKNQLDSFHFWPDSKFNVHQLFWRAVNSDKTYLLNFHVDEIEKISKFSTATNLKMVMLNCPTDPASNVYNRMSRHGINNYAELEKIYTPKYIADRILFDDILVIDSVEFHQPTIDPIISQLNNFLNINLSVNDCNRLHKIWLSKLYT